MKKILLIVSTFIILMMASCTGDKGNTRKVIYDEPAPEINTALKLDSVKNGTSLNADTDKTKPYSEVFVAQDCKSTLFYQTIDLDNYLKSGKVKELILNILYFNKDIPSDDAKSFLKIMNDENYGLNKERVGSDFNADGTDLYGQLAITKSIKIPSDMKTAYDDKALLFVAYLPTYCIYNDGKQDYTKVFMLIPLYYAFTYGSKVADYAKTMPNYQVELVKGVLPSA